MERRSVRSRTQTRPGQHAKAGFVPQTLALSYMCGTISRLVWASPAPFQEASCGAITCVLCSYYETKAVLLAVGITALVCAAVTLFCFQTKVSGCSSGVGLWPVRGLSAQKDQGATQTAERRLCVSSYRVAHCSNIHLVGK